MSRKRKGRRDNDPPSSETDNTTKREVEGLIHIASNQEKERQEKHISVQSVEQVVIEMHVMSLV